MALASVVVSGAATLLFFYFSYYFWFEVEPNQITFGLLWLVVALSAPVAAVLAHHVGMRLGQRGPALLTRVSATALVTTCAALCLYFALYVLAALLL